MGRRVRLKTGKLETRSPGKSVRTVRTREAFVEELRNGRSWQGACDAVEVSRSAMYKWYNDPSEAEFKAECDDAMEGANDRFEDEVVRRGVKGVLRKVRHQGVVVGYEREYSDRMLENLLAARRPGKWGKRGVELSGPGGGPVNTTTTPLTKDQLIEEMAKRGLPTQVFDK